jgi:uncharacterized pyridoxal phosphate-containing UPF0001 family protein
MGHFAGELQTDKIINFLTRFSNNHSVEQLLGWKKIRRGPFWAVNVFRLKGL